MLELCRQCGADLKKDGVGYKCTCCGAKYESLSELHPEREVSPASCGGEYTNIQQFGSGVDVFDMNIKSVLEITWNDESSTHSGSGFLVSAGGYAVTNAHVVTYENGKSCGKVNVKLGGESLTASVIKLGDNKHGSGKGTDLAVIKLDRMPAGASVVSFGDFNYVRNGERVFVIGNSLGYGTCITSGIVSDRARNVGGKTLIMTDCPVNSGNSGGPMVNERGLVIGAIVSGMAGAEGMNFAIPSNTVLEFLKKSGMI
jgi:S1-C subfamily serine protease